MHPIIIIAHYAVYALAGALFFYSVYTDYKQRVIPNMVSYGFIFLTVVYALINQYAEINIISGVIVGLLVYGLGYLAYRYNLVGGGDVKLWSSASLFFGVQAPHFLFYMTIFGMVLAIVSIVCQRIVKNKQLPVFLSDETEMPNHPLLNLGSPEMPYGIAIGASGITILAYNIILMGLK